ncbi:MAG: M20/M25/M40 family metallo-hydrolase [Phycisphaerales bacterium]
MDRRRDVTGSHAADLLENHMKIGTPIAWLAASALSALAAAGNGAPEPARVESARLEATLRALPVKRSAAGDLEHIDGLERAQTWIKDQVRALGYEPQTQRVVFGGRPRPDATPEQAAARARTWENIILELPGKEHPNQVLIVGAHFDAVPDTPGADDNATGVATLLEMARVLKDRPMKRTVRLIFFNLEEVGLVGSSQYAARFAERVSDKSEHLVGMISLEMLGFYSDAPGSQQAPFKGLDALGLPTVGDFIALAGVLSGREFIRQLEEQMRRAEPACRTFVFDFSPIAPPDILRSDHAPFLLRGLPAVMLTDTANFRNPHYHEPTDTIETLDLQRLTRTAAAVTQAVHAIAAPAGGPDAPKPSLEGLPDLSTLMTPDAGPEKTVAPK